MKHLQFVPDKKFSDIPPMLPQSDFLRTVDTTPLVAMDMVVVRGGTEILLGLRNNRPAQGFWFVPGGRIRKNEPMQTALARVAMDELGLNLASPTAHREAETAKAHRG